MTIYHSAQKAPRCEEEIVASGVTDSNAPESAAAMGLLYANWIRVVITLNAQPSSLSLSLSLRLGLLPEKGGVISEMAHSGRSVWHLCPSW